MTVFLADENFDGPSVSLLRGHGFDVNWVAEIAPGLSDRKIIGMADVDSRTILTHDSDFGELIFRHGFRPRGGVVYFRVPDFRPTEPGLMLIELMRDARELTGRLTVVDRDLIRQRRY